MTNATPETDSVDPNFDVRAEIGARYGLPEALISRLRGETPEELEADAEALAAVLPEAPGSLAGASRPANYLGGGLDPREDRPQPFDRQDFEGFLALRRSGNAWNSSETIPGLY